MSKTSGDKRRERFAQKAQDKGWIRTVVLVPPTGRSLIHKLAKQMRQAPSEQRQAPTPSGISAIQLAKLQEGLDARCASIMERLAHLLPRLDESALTRLERRVALTADDAKSEFAK